MFDTLDEQIAKTQGPERSQGARALGYIGLFVLSAIVFVGLYLAIRLVG